MKEHNKEFHLFSHHNTVKHNYATGQALPHEDKEAR